MSEKKPVFALATPQVVNCLRCGTKFTSPDKRRNRICPRCSYKKS